ADQQAPAARGLRGGAGDRHDPRHDHPGGGRMSTVTLEMLGQVVLAAGDSGDGDPRMFGLILFASGFVFYGLVYLRYRNTDKRHHHESETEARILDVQAWDQFVELKKGVKNARMRGANNREVRG